MLLRSSTSLIAETPWNTVCRTTEAEAVTGRRRHGAWWPLEAYLRMGLLTAAECLQRSEAEQAVSCAGSLKQRVHGAMDYVPRYLSCHNRPMTWEALDDNRPATQGAPLPEGHSEAVERFLALLTPAQRACVQRCWLDGQPVTAAAKAPGCTHTKVLRRLESAKLRLRAHLEGRERPQGGPPRGVRKGSRLDGQAATIRAWLDAGLSTGAITRQLGVSRGALAHFLRSRSHTHPTEGPTVCTA